MSQDPRDEPLLWVLTSVDRVVNTAKSKEVTCHSHLIQYKTSQYSLSSMSDPALSASCSLFTRSIKWPGCSCRTCCVHPQHVRGTCLLSPRMLLRCCPWEWRTEIKQGHQQEPGTNCQCPCTCSWFSLFEINSLQPVFRVSLLGYLLLDSMRVPLEINTRIFNDNPLNKILPPNPRNIKN